MYFGYVALRYDFYLIFLQKYNLKKEYITLVNIVLINEHNFNDNNWKI